MPADEGDGRAPGGDRHIGRFRNEVARRRYMTAYDDALAAWPSRPRELDVNTRFGSTHVLAAGPASGTPIVLLHGVALSAPSWFANVAALSAVHPVYAIDTIGDVGRSTQTVPVFTGVDVARWLDDVLTALDLRGVHLVGVSYGGWLALNQARHSPDRLASVTAVDPVGAIGGAKKTFFLRLLPDGILALVAKSEPAIQRLLRRFNNGTIPDQPLLELSVAGLLTFRTEQPFPKRMSDGDLREIHTPTLLFFCERSPVNHAQRAAERTRDLVSNASVYVIPDAGHMLPVEKPELFARRVLDFVRDLDTQVT